MASRSRGKHLFSCLLCSKGRRTPPKKEGSSSNPDSGDGETIPENKVGDENGVLHHVTPKQLEIIWGDDKTYWNLSSGDNGNTAELLRVCWLEVTGSLELKKLKSKTYIIKFKVSMKEDAFGWDGRPVHLMVKVGGNRTIWKTADLSGRPPSEQFDIPDDLQFEVKEEDLRGDGKLTFGLYEIWTNMWKGGLLIHGVDISPI